MSALFVYSRLLVYYAGSRSFESAQEKVVKYDYKRAFDEMTIRPDGVAFGHPARSLEIHKTFTVISVAGDPFEVPVIDVAFEVLGLLNFSNIIQVRPTCYFAVAVPDRTLVSLVEEHIKLLESPKFNFASLGPITDTAVILSTASPDGATTNAQFGPMGRDQWQTFGGPQVQAVESSLPAVAWGIGFFHQGPIHAVSLSLQQAKERLIETSMVWRDLASKFFV